MTEEIEQRKKEILRSDLNSRPLERQNIAVRILTDLTYPEPNLLEQNRQTIAMKFQVKLVCKTEDFDKEYLLRSVCPTLVQNLEIF